MGVKLEIGSVATPLLQIGPDAKARGQGATTVTSTVVYA
jgi:hypothetical protein